MHSYQTGMATAVIIAVTLPHITLFIGAILLIRLFKGMTKPKSKLIYILLSIFIRPICVMLTTLPILYCTLNLISQNLLDLEFWKMEFSNGILPLRIASYFLTWKLAQSFLKTMMSSVKINEIRTASKSVRLLAKIIPTDPEKDQIKLEINSSIHFALNSQSIFYLTVLNILWICVAKDISNSATLISSWALLFIIDDWSIISDYMQEFKTSSIDAHDKKITIFNYGLFLSVISMYFFGLGKELIIPAAISMTTSLYFTSKAHENIKIFQKINSTNKFKRSTTILFSSINHLKTQRRSQKNRVAI